MYDEVWSERHYKFDNYKALRGVDWTTYKTITASDSNRLAELIDKILTFVVVAVFLSVALYSLVSINI